MFFIFKNTIFILKINIKNKLIYRLYAEIF